MTNKKTTMKKTNSQSKTKKIHKSSAVTIDSLNTKQIESVLFSKTIPTWFLDNIVSIPMLKSECALQLQAQKQNYIEKKTEIGGERTEIKQKYQKQLEELDQKLVAGKIKQSAYEAQTEKIKSSFLHSRAYKKAEIKYYNKQKRKIKDTLNERVANLKYMLDQVEQYALAYKKKYPDKKDDLKLIDTNLAYLREAILYRGSKNHKYFTSDLIEYQQMKKKPILFVRNLTKFYSRKKVPNIDNLNFDVYAGEFHAFIGANGAGKTTTIKSLITSYYNWSGTILINGIKNLEEAAKKKIGYIPEKAVFPDGFNTYDYLKWMVMLSGLNKEQACKVTEQQLKSIGMWNMRHRSPNTFSSGQKKKVLLSQTLIHDPDIIIMDEPVANLDPKARIDFFDNLMELRKRGKAVFISSHVLAELDMYADALTILDGGKIVYSGLKSTLLKRYDTGKHFLSIPITRQKLVEAYLNKNKVKMVSNHNGNNIEYELKFKNDKASEDFVRYLSNKKIVFDSFYKIKPSLEDIYRKMIVLGSKDTMQENMAANRTEGSTNVAHFGKTY